MTQTLLTQADRICVSIPDRDVEKRRITGALSSNGYPTALVKNWHLKPHSPPFLELDTSKAVVVIPYVKHLSESIGRILSPLKIHACFRPHRTLRLALVNLKDRVPFQQKAGVIYIQDPLQWLPQSVCRLDRQNIGPMAKGTQTVCSEWTPGRVGGLHPPPD